MIRKGALLLISILSFLAYNSKACTNFLVSRGATVDGSTMITYAADAHVLFGELYYRPAATHETGDKMSIYEWDTGKYLGEIDQVPYTYSVVGNMNEHQLAIGETTYGGREECQGQTDGIMDYGSLIYVTLQRAATAREAIRVMGDLVERYGYYSSGESFSIADPNEVWIMELIGKGAGEKGAVWVAVRVPDGTICGHANQARITTFPLNDPRNCLYSKDVISFANEKGWFNGKNKDFSFSDTYAPVDFGAARFCEARVWSGFRKVKSGMDVHEAYVSGAVKYDSITGYATNRMPLFITPDKKLELKDVFGIMRDHYEGTSLDMTKDIGAGPHKRPYRWRPMTWEVDSTRYLHERAISTQQTGFSFVSQSRADYPDPIGGILWFGMDDTYSTCYVPMYCGITEIPESFKVGNGDMLTYSETSAFWTFNMVTNLTYLRYSDMIVDVQKVQSELEDRFIQFTPAIDQAALVLWNTSEDVTRDFLTEYSMNAANNTTKRWKELFRYLLVKYKDGNIMKEKDGQFERTETGMPVSPNQPALPTEWYRKVIKETGDHLKYGIRK